MCRAHWWPVRSFMSKENNCYVMQSAEGDRAVNMSHAGFPPRSLFCHWNFTWKPKSGPETIQTLIHVQVNTLLIMVYAHCTDSISHRQAVNATSCPGVAIVVLFYTHILHLLSFKGQEFLKSQTDTIYYWIKVASAECFFLFFFCRYWISWNLKYSHAKVSASLTAKSFLAEWKSLWNCFYNITHQNPSWYENNNTYI